MQELFLSTFKQRTTVYCSMRMTLVIHPPARTMTNTQERGHPASLLVPYSLPCVCHICLCIVLHLTLCTEPLATFAAALVSSFTLYKQEPTKDRLFCSTSRDSPAFQQEDPDFFMAFTVFLSCCLPACLSVPYGTRFGCFSEL